MNKNRQLLIDAINSMEPLENDGNPDFYTGYDTAKEDVIRLIDQFKGQENELEISVKEAFGIVVNKVRELVEYVHENMNWFYRKDDGLLYFYKYKPAVRKSYGISPMLSKADIITPVEDDEKVFPETNNSLGFVTKGVLMHRDDVIKGNTKQFNPLEG